MLRPHVIQVTGKFALASIIGKVRQVNGLRAEGQIILSGSEPLAPSFDPRSCGKKTQ
jgi:hypothetical protein